MTTTRPDTPADLGTLCQLVEWDSEFFERRIARINPALLVRDGVSAALEWCENQRVECAYLLADAGDHAVCDIAQAQGFRLVDVRVTLDGAALRPAIESPADGLLIRPVRPDDVERLKSIARKSHRDTRFYADRHFDRQRCDQLYELWIANSCGGWANHVLVCEIDGVAAGYLTCHLRDRVGQIGLLAVATDSQGAGAGSTLVAAAGGWFVQAGAHRMSVVTQARNAAALPFYQAAGMTVQSIQLWFHKWWERR